MNSPGVPKAIFSDDEQKHAALEIVDALLNLLYLVRLDASEPAQVAAYAEQSELLLSKMQGLILAGGSRKGSKAPDGKVRVLVIDDDSAVARTLGLIFSKAGYETRAVESAEQALALLETEDWVPQLAVIDVHLPGMNGIDLAVRLKAHYPDMRMTLFSGRAETTDLLEEAQRQGHCFHVLPKPVHPTVFLGMAERLLGEPGQEGDPIQ